MATPNVGILTNAGKNLIDQVNAGQIKITFSKIVFSSMNNNQLTDEQIKALTTVAPQEIVVNNPKVTLDNNTGETRIRATGNNEALTDGVYVKTYAVYAKDDSGNEILYGITVSPNPNYLPEYDGVTPQAVTYSYKVNISNTSNITFTNPNDIYVSDTDLAEALQPYAKTIDVNQQLDKKVVDNRDGTEQLNGVRVQPYNKLSDVTNLRNIVLQTDNVIPYTAKGGVGNTIQNFPLYSGFSALPSGTQIYYSYDLVVTNADGGVHWLGWDSPWSAFVKNQSITTDGIHHFQGTTTIPDANITSSKGIHSTIDGSHATYQITNLMIVVGSIPVTHLPAPEDTVNVSDMRKPASDVAGIEEVNAKQDAIGYTPADDSKVVHLDDLLGGRNYAIGGKSLTATDDGSGNNYPTSLAFEISPDVWGKQVTISYTATISGFTGKSSLATDKDAYVDLKLYNALGGVYSSRGATGNITKDGDYPVVWKGYIGDLASGGKSQGNFRTNLNSGAKITISKLMIELGNVQHDWVPAIEDMADDSKVAHLSGANNFGIVPTVNNNPLLLASSLPSDLARTGQSQTFTAAQTFSIAPTIKDASKDKGDNQAATMANLKSVEASAWRELDLSGTSGIYQGRILIKIDQANQYVYFIMNAQVPLKAYTKGTKIIDLSSVVTGLSSAHGYFQGWINDLENPYSITGSTMVASGSSIELGDDYNRMNTDGVTRIVTEADDGKQYCYAVYNSLVNN